MELAESCSECKTVLMDPKICSPRQPDEGLTSSAEIRSLRYFEKELKIPPKQTENFKQSIKLQRVQIIKRV